jgi:hypothetical protein
VAARQASGFSSRYGSYRPTAQARPDAVPEFVEEIYDLTLRRPEHGIAAIEAAQAGGHVDPAWQPIDLLVLLFAIGLAWAQLPHPDAVTQDAAVTRITSR